MKLYLCEKPSQAADIAAHVGARRRGEGCFEGELHGERVVVTYAVGHLLELIYPEGYDPALKQWRLENLPFIPEHNGWRMEPKPGTLKQFKVVEGLLKQASSVVIATDADREGEMIARELMDYCGYRGPAQRMWITALDDASIKKALGKLLPDSKTKGMYGAALGRSRSDWAMGLNLTRALTVAFGSGGGSKNVLNCGRVQTPVMALVVRRERKIASFAAQPYFDLGAQFDIANTLVPMRWQMPAALKAQQAPFVGALDEAGRIVKREVLDAVASKVKGNTGRVSTVEQESKSERAPLPYSLSSLQVACSKRFGMKPTKTLEIAQALYEKHKATSYPRTDCEYLPESMLAEVPAVLSALGTAQDLASSAPDLPALLGAASKRVAAPQIAVVMQARPPRVFNDKNVTAHHAIIPTLKQNVNVATMSLVERQVYDLIVRRYLAQFLGDHEYQQTDVTVLCEGEAFVAKGKVTTEPGWKLCYPVKPKPSVGTGGAESAGMSAGDADGEAAQDSKADDVVHLPAVREGMQAHNREAVVNRKLTTPPPRYTEGTLLAAMEAIDKEIEDPRWKEVMKGKEKAGIGTDATRASIIEGLFTNAFFTHHAKHKKHIIPTDKANSLFDILSQVAPTVVDPVLTAMWEEMLSQVQAGALSLPQYETAIATWVSSVIANIKNKAKDGIKVAAAPEKAPKATNKPATGAVSNSTHASSTSAQQHKAPVSPAKAPGQPCPKCSTGKLALTPSKKYPGSYLLTCAGRECGHWEWAPK